jgi:hypothetical protein
VPPSIVLNQEVSLPDLLPVFDPRPPDYAVGEFVMPPVRHTQSTTVEALTVAPEISGTAPAASDLRAWAELVDLPRLPAPQRAMAQPPPAAVEPVHATPAVNGILSISENPAVPQEFLLVPPANQVARGGTPSAVWNGLLALAGIGRDVGGAIASIAALSGESDSHASLPGTTEVKHPKDGKFGVVVTGSSVASPYPQSAGSLSGKVVYTVYVGVGKRKNWILQYSLPKTSGSSFSAEGSRAALEAPWPYDIVRPNHGNDSDYVVVHGVVTKDGHFEELDMVFPPELEGKELLLQSLKRWAFRPATRDGEQASVEVLLIIPRETE